MMHSAKRVSINTGFLYARLAITVFISLYATRLVLAALGVDDFGIFSVVGGAVSMLTFLNVAMSAATLRFMSYAEGEGNIEKQKKIFNVSMVLHVLIAIVVVLLLEIVGYFLFNGILQISLERITDAKLIFHFMVVSTFFSIVSVPYDAVINAHENMLLVAILGILETVFKLGIAIYITYTNYDRLIIYGFLMAVLSILLVIVRQIYCHNKYNEVQINIKKYYNKPLFKEITLFAGWSFLGTSTSMIANYGQGIVLNLFFGTKVNAAQGVANQVSGQLGAFAGTMQKALNPVIAKSEGAGKRDLMLKASMMGSKLSFFLLMVLFIPVLVEMPYIFKIWLKDVPEYAIIFCRLLLIRNLIDQMSFTLSSSISAVGNIRRYQIVTSLLHILPLFFSFLLFQMRYPAYTLYYVFIVYSILISFITIYFAKVYCGLSIGIFLKNIVTRCIVSFIIVYALSFVPTIYMQAGLNRLIIVFSISIFSFLLTVWIIGFVAEERLIIVKLIREEVASLILRLKKMMSV
jgi:O-antigen/teichoic acid export membrane protein